MNAPYLAAAGQPPRFPACDLAEEKTVYLRRQMQGWIVSLDEAVLLLTSDEEDAFRYACEARRVEGGEPLRLLILSGPSAANYKWAVANLNEAQAPPSSAVP